MLHRKTPRLRRSSPQSVHLELVPLEDRNAGSDITGYLLHGTVGVGAIAYGNALGSDRDAPFGSSAVIKTFDSDFASRHSPLLRDHTDLSAVSPDFLSQGRRASAALQDWLRDQADLDENKGRANEGDEFFTSTGGFSGGALSVLGDGLLAGGREDRKSTRLNSSH